MGERLGSPRVAPFLAPSPVSFSYNLIFFFRGSLSGQYYAHTISCENPSIGPLGRAEPAFTFWDRPEHVSVREGPVRAINGRIWPPRMGPMEHRSIGHLVGLGASFACIYYGQRNSNRVKRYACLKRADTRCVPLYPHKRINLPIHDGCDHTSTNAPDPIRTPKLSVLGRE